MKVMLKNDAGLQKATKLGFSWTTLFFGFFPALFRGDWLWALIIFAAGLITFGISTVVFAFIYNKIYINNLMEKGFKPADEYSQAALVSKGIVSQTSNA